MTHTFKHSKGPWTLNGDSVMAETDTLNDAGYPMSMGVCSIWDEMDNAASDAENKANARLITAAPIMIDAITSALDSLRGPNAKSSIPDAVAALTYAYYHATGKQYKRE